MSRMLYYPLVNPPANLLAEATLYWDAIGSRAPSYYAYTPTLEMLADAGIYIPIEPNTLPGKRVSDIAAEIEDLLDRMSVEALRIPEGPLNRSNRLYQGKLPARIEHELDQYGLLKEENGVFRASGQLLAPILAIVARAIADDQRRRNVRRNWVCHTDIDQAYLAAYSAGQRTDNTPAWKLELGELFLKPTPDTRLEDLIKFRKKYDDERRRLLSEVDKVAGVLGGNGNFDVLPQLATAIDTAMDDYKAAAKSHNLKLVAGSTVAVIGAEIGILGELEAALPAMGLLGGILVAKGLEHVRRGPASPYTYLHRIESTFATKPRPT